MRGEGWEGGKEFKRATMSDRYLDDYLPVVAIDVAVEEKTRIVRMAATTLHKLRDVMRQMKDWRNDSARLKSDIWRMKMALRAEDDDDGNEDRRDDERRIDPWIVQQRTEIGRLERANEALLDEVASLKRALAKAGEAEAARVAESLEDERIRANEEAEEIPSCPKEAAEEARISVALRRLRDRLWEHARDDRAIETILANAIGRVVETIVGLSEELVNVSEDLCRLKTRNGRLRRRVDRLRAMLRSRCGSGAEYRRRIGELNGLARRLTGEMDLLRVIIRESASRGEGGAEDIPGVVGRVGRLMNELKDTLRCDRVAMTAAGDPDRLRYMRRVVDLRVNLKVLSVELKRSSASMREERGSCGSERHERCSRAASLLNDFLKELDVEIGELKARPMDEYCRIGGVSGARYMTRVAELEDVVKKSAAAIAVLNRGFPLVVANTGERTPAEELQDLIGRLCGKISDLETLDDRSCLRERIGQLEAAIAHLKSELAERNDRMRALNDEHASVRSTLESDRVKYERLVGEVRRENDILREEMERGKREMAEMSREREHRERRVAEIQLMKVEIDAVGKKLRQLHDDKEALLGEAEGMRNILRERDKEIENIITRRDTLKAVLGAEIKDLRMKLGIASDENAKLKSIIEGLGEGEGEEEGGRPDKLKSSVAEGGGEGRDNGERARNPGDESVGAGVAERNDDGPTTSLSEANGQIDRLRRALDEAVGDRARLEDEISDLRSNEKSLAHRLNARTSAGDRASRECRRATAENRALEDKVKRLQHEKEQLRAELSRLRCEKGSLDRATTDANNRCVALQEQVNRFKSEHNALRERASERETAAGSLRLELEGARAKVADAAAEMARLRSENSRLAGELDALTARRDAEAEERVRVLLTEKNELATRINELDAENVGLRDRLSKARTENEYFSAELNKSRIENDEATARRALLQVTCDRLESDNGELRRERDEARERLDAIGSERGTLGDRSGYDEEAPRIRATAALRRENSENRTEKIDARRALATWKRDFADVRNNERGRSDVARTSAKTEIGAERRDSEAESDTGEGDDDKARIKDEPKSELKGPRIGSEALKSEPANLRSGSAGVTTMEPARAKDEFESRSCALHLRWTKVPNDGETVGSLSDGLEIANIRYGNETNDYSSYSDDSKMKHDGDEGRSSVVGAIDRLEAENIALRMEIDVLRSSLNFALMDGEKTRADYLGASEEIRALKNELMNLRDERATSRSRLEMFKEELNGLESERVALKDELAAARKSNFDLRLKANGLRSANEKLKGTNVILESRLRDALRATNEYIAISRTSDKGMEDNLESVNFEKGNLPTIKKRLERVPVKNNRISAEEHLQRTEGQNRYS